MDLKRKVVATVLAVGAFSLGFHPGDSQAGKAYYIAPSGSDSNAGTLQSPWKTLNSAITKAGAGDTLIMRGGTYTPNEVWMRGDRGVGGANGQYLTIKNYPGEVPSVGGDRRIIVEGVDYLRVEGLYFRLPYNITGGGIGFQVVNCTFEGPQPGFGAIEFFSDGGLIEGNVIKITGGGDTQDHGIYLHAGHNNVLRNNYISGHFGYGIHVYDAVSSGGSGAAYGYDNILIEGNVILNSAARAGIIVFPDGASVEAKNIIIRKNIIANHPINAIRLRGNTYNAEVYNNTIFGNGFGADHTDDMSAISVREVEAHDIVFRNNIIQSEWNESFHIQNRENSTGIVAEKNLYWGLGSPQLKGVTSSSELYGDPLFKDATNFDFTLLSTSPAIDKGLNLGLAYVGTAPDLGALEFGSTTSVVETGNQPQEFALHQNYPNPFNPATTISYEVRSPGMVTLNIYGTTGQLIKSLVHEQRNAGPYTAQWDGNDARGNRVASGVYFYQLSVAGASGPGANEMKKMVLLK